MIQGTTHPRIMSNDVKAAQDIPLVVLTSSDPTRCSIEPAHLKPGHTTPNPRFTISSPIITTKCPQSVGFHIRSETVAPRQGTSRGQRDMDTNTNTKRTSRFTDAYDVTDLIQHSEQNIRLSQPPRRWPTPWPSRMTNLLHLTRSVYLVTGPEGWRSASEPTNPLATSPVPFTT